MNAVKELPGYISGQTANQPTTADFNQPALLEGLAIAKPFLSDGTRVIFVNLRADFYIQSISISS
jgi:hypothetical protein